MTQLDIFIFSGKQIAERLRELLKGDRYCLKQVSEADELLDVVQSEPIDCLIIASDSTILGLFNQLYEQEILLPTIIIESEANNNKGKSLEAATYLYHIGEVRLLETEIEAIAASIERAIAQFLHLGTDCAISTSAIPASQSQSLMQQQHRLSQKFKELGYLGVYSQREPQKFYRNLQPHQKQKLLAQLKTEYRQIILDYFSQDSQDNQDIDKFVNQAFFADLAISQILEMHMELMDEFAQQLKLEERSEEILLDYRLTLIDVIAHLGEMYRRSIPKKVLFGELFFQKN